MKKVMMLLSLILIAGGSIATVSADNRVCTPNGCFIVKDAPSEPSGLHWKQRETDYLLYDGGECVGRYDISDGTYHVWSGGVLGEATKPPIDPPGTAKLTDEQKRWCSNGICNTKLYDGETPKVTHSGREIHHSQITEAMDGRLNDDSKKGWLIIWSKDDAKRNKVYEDWKKLPDDFTSRYNVWMAPPDHFSMQDRFAGKPRFFTEGDPTIVLEQPDGTVLFRRPRSQQNYQASDMQALLKADPDYKPASDPGATEASPFKLPGHIVVAIVIGILGLILLLFRRKV